MDKFIGKKLDGRYLIQEIIGVGGMAIVYKAYDSIDDRTVAVKILKEEFLSNEEFKRRFKNESKAIAVLSHPNIVKVYDVSLSDRLQYIVMEYIDGITLKEYIDQQKVLKWKEAVHFTVQILRAMQHAHEKGIVHRDLKPQNIMLLQDGTIKVTDFGIARFARSETRTITDKAIGSVHYISPEQARGGFIDEKADIYSVGVMLFEMLTGQLPFEADSPVSVAIMQLQSDPKHPRDINDTIPEGLEDITLRAMQKDPTARYQSAADMLKDIDEFKKNPSIHFEYKYFVDESPTRFVDAINQVRQDDAEEEEPQKRNNLIPILSGIAAAFVLVVVIGIIFIFVNPGNSGMVATPKLIGMKYDDAIVKYNNFRIVPQTHKDSTEYPAGVICEQTPNPSIRSKKNGTIQVVISNGSPKTKVPDVYSLPYDDAANMITNAGLVPSKIEMYNTDVPKGMVIKTSPAKSQEIAVGQTVTIYISVDKNPNQVIVKDYVGQNIDSVLSRLTNDKVKQGNVDYKDSTEKKGTILSQDPVKDSAVAADTAINFVVSNGNAPSKPVTLTVDLSFLSGTTDIVDVMILQDGATQISNKYSTDRAQPFKFEGNGKSEFDIRINGVKYQIIKVDFGVSGDPSVLTGPENKDAVLASFGSSSSSKNSNSSSGTSSTW